MRLRQTAALTLGEYTTSILLIAPDLSVEPLVKDNPVNVTD